MVPRPRKETTPQSNGVLRQFGNIMKAGKGHAALMISKFFCLASISRLSDLLPDASVGQIDTRTAQYHVFLDNGEQTSGEQALQCRMPGCLMVPLWALRIYVKFCSLSIPSFMDAMPLSVLAGGIAFSACLVCSCGENNNNNNDNNNNDNRV